MLLATLQTTAFRYWLSDASNLDCCCGAFQPYIVSTKTALVSSVPG